MIISNVLSIETTTTMKESTVSELPSIDYPIGSSGITVRNAYWSDNGNQYIYSKPTMNN